MSYVDTGKNKPKDAQMDDCMDGCLEKCQLATKYTYASMLYIKAASLEPSLLQAIYLSRNRSSCFES